MLVATPIMQVVKRNDDSVKLGMVCRSLISRTVVSKEGGSGARDEFELASVLFTATYFQYAIYLSVWR